MKKTNKQLVEEVHAHVPYTMAVIRFRQANVVKRLWYALIGDLPMQPLAKPSQK